MAQKTYITRATSFGHLLNREAVEKGAMEGRIIPPLVEYLPEGSEVKLDSDSPQTEKLVASGALHDPSGGGGFDSLKKAELEDLAAEHDVDLSAASNNAERAQALRDAGVPEPSE